MIIKDSSFFTCLMLLALATMTSCNLSKNTTDIWVKEDYYGKVKSIEYVSYNAFLRNDSFIKGDITFRHLNKFNRHGNITELLLLEKDGNVRSGTFYLYDVNNNMKMKIFFTSSRKDSSKTIYIYDSKLNKIEDVSENGERVVYVHDKKQHRILTTRFNSKGTIRDKSIYFFDKNNNLIERDVLDTNDIILKQSLMKYDKKGNLLEQSYHDNISNKKNEVNKDDFLLKKTLMMYDKKGNLLERTHYVGGVMEWKKTYIYDKFGNGLGEFDSREDIPTSNDKTIIYTYDRKNNWIRRIILKNSYPTSIEEQIIEYY